MTSPVAPFAGVHCETVATGTLLTAICCDVSEPLLFGLGEAFGFIFMNLSSVPLGFLGGRSKPFSLTLAACRHLGLSCHERQTTSVTRAWRNLETELGDGRPVGLQLDCFHLPYFTRAPHFAGHFVAATGLVGGEVEVVDTVQQGTTRRVPRAALEAARHARGPMSARARSYTIEGDPITDLGAAVLAAARRTGSAYLDPSFGGMGAPGLAKLARALPRWRERAESPGEDLRLAADLIERAGTGGALFRNLYRGFLTEAADLLPAHSGPVLRARERIAASATMWTAVAGLLDRCAADGSDGHLREAAALCGPIAEAELGAMTILAEL